MLKHEIPILRAEDIAKVVDRKEEFFPVPEWTPPDLLAAGGVAHLRLRSWTLEQRDLITAQARDPNSPDGKMDPQKLVRLLVRHGVEEPQLTEDLILQKDPAVIDRIALRVMALNGMTKEAALSASMSFRPESGSDIPVSAGQGFEVNGSSPAA